jgi:glycosyltransferase involved in cell wall biosynthesis
MANGPVVEVVADGSPGGGTTAVLGLCSDLRQRLSAGVVLITQQDSYAFHQGQSLGLTVYGQEFFRSRFDLGLRMRLSGLVRSLKPALVHAHGGRAAHALIGAARAYPLIYTVHGYHFTQKNPLIRPVYKYAEARNARHADHIVFVSESDRRIAESNGLMSSRTEHTVIRNGVDPRELGRNDDVERDDVILFLSRMHRQKNPALAIEMMAHLRDVPVRLVMIGGGDLEGQMKAVVERLNLGASVQLLGALPRDQALAHLRRARAMVFPSLWEGLPIAPMEALYFGVPVVATDIPGTDEVVAHGRNGILVGNPTPLAMAAAVRDLLENPARWAQLSAAGKQDAALRFSRQANSNAYVALYQRLAGVAA